MKDLETLELDLDGYMKEYNYIRTHRGKRCQGRTAMDTFLEGKKCYDAKNLENQAA